MEYRKSMIILILAIFLFSMAGVYAGDADDMISSGKDATQIGLSPDDDWRHGDNQDNLETTQDKISTGNEQKTFTDLDSEVKNSTDTLEIRFD